MPLLAITARMRIKKMSGADFEAPDIFYQKMDIYSFPVDFNALRAIKPIGKKANRLEAQGRWGVVVEFWLRTGSEIWLLSGV